MILSDKTLKSMIAAGKLIVTPIDEKSIQPASIDCRLGDHFLVVEQNQMEIISLDCEIKYREITSDSIIIPPLPVQSPHAFYPCPGKFYCPR